MKPKEVVLLIVLIAVGIVFTEIRAGRIDIDLNLGDFEGLDHQAFTYQESQVVQPPLPASLIVENAHGDVIVAASDTDKVTITLEKKIWRRQEAQARAIADGLHVRVEKGAAGLVIGTNRQDFKRRNFETNLRLTVPAATAVDIKNSFGLVSVHGLASAVIVNPHGEVAVEEMAGEVRIENSYEDVTLSGDRGGCDIRSAHADVSAKAIGGNVRVDDPYGLVTLRRLAGKAAVTGAHAEVSAEDVAGAVDVQNSYDKVTLRRVGPSKITGHHSDVEVVGVDGGLEIVTSYAEVSAASVVGGLRVTGRSIQLSGANLSGGEIYVSTSYEPVELSAFSGKSTILVSHGDVTLTPLPLTGPVEVRCDYSPLNLHWPAGGPYPLQASCRSGKIIWGLDEPARAEEKNGVDEIRAFSEAGNKPGIVLVTSYDDIRVEKD